MSTLPSRVLNRAKTNPFDITQYLLIGGVLCGVVFTSFVLANIAGHILVQEVLASIPGTSTGEAAFRIGIAVFISALAWTTSFVIWEFFTPMPLPREVHLELPRYEIWGMSAVVPAALVLCVLWTAPLWTPVLNVSSVLTDPFINSPSHNTYSFALVAVGSVFSFLKLSREHMQDQDNGAFIPVYKTQHVMPADAPDQTSKSSRSSPDSTPDTTNSPNPSEVSPSSGSPPSNNTSETNTAQEPTTETSDTTNRGQSGAPPSSYEYDWQSPPPLRFSDVGGMDDLKQELESEILRPLSGDIEKYREFGVGIPNLLLYGPPGTGKTYLAKALAGELAYPYVKLSAADVTSQWINASGDKVTTLFNEAEELGKEYGYAIVFIDEIDALLASRDQGQQHSENKKVVNEFLNHLSETEERHTLFIGATNNVDELDQAATRAGRLDKKVHVGLPDIDARTEILRVHLEQRPGNLDTSPSLRNVVKPLIDWSAADIELMVEQAARRAVEREANGIEMEDIQDAVNSMQ